MALMHKFVLGESNDKPTIALSSALGFHPCEHKSHNRCFLFCGEMCLDTMNGAEKKKEEENVLSMLFSKSEKRFHGEVISSALWSKSQRLPTVKCGWPSRF